MSAALLVWAGLGAAAAALRRSMSRRRHGQTCCCIMLSASSSARRSAACAPWPPQAPVSKEACHPDHGQLALGHADHGQAGAGRRRQGATCCSASWGGGLHSGLGGLCLGQRVLGGLLHDRLLRGFWQTGAVPQSAVQGPPPWQPCLRSAQQTSVGPALEAWAGCTGAALGSGRCLPALQGRLRYQAAPARGVAGSPASMPRSSGPEGCPAASRDPSGEGTALSMSSTMWASCLGGRLRAAEEVLIAGMVCLRRRVGAWLICGEDS